ncbi:hypothetical protein MUK42_03804 [Musa troglodytarum]|uniref:Uncharacterized protein n=1 Tax=Musa troglodytarum TaxID=320322 RepID=A0A9E7GI18_9LILI|nr:hypothetical protein MUK42_03804 [Musa troglodytarum]URE15176.1 hypothetical protein MUK42_03804 [Musa troglodytarum]
MATHGSSASHRISSDDCRKLSTADEAPQHRGDRGAGVFDRSVVDFPGSSSNLWMNYISVVTVELLIAYCSFGVDRNLVPRMFSNPCRRLRIMKLSDPTGICTKGHDEVSELAGTSNILEDQLGAL